MGGAISPRQELRRKQKVIYILQLFHKCLLRACYGPARDMRFRAEKLNKASVLWSIPLNCAHKQEADGRQ